MRHHVCLISQQPMPNFLPMLQRDLKPDRVTLVVSEKMKELANFFRKSLEEIQIEVTDDIYIGANESNIAEIEEVLVNWLDQNNHDGIMLNVTGGTKPMAIAAQEVFRMANHPVFYVDIKTDQVTWITEEKRHQIHLTHQPTLKQAFQLNGRKFISGSEHSSIQNEKWRTFGESLAKNIAKWGGALGLLNAKAGEAEQKHTLTCPLSKSDYEVLHELLFELSGNELTKNESSLIFKSKEARSFCNGGWLEHMVFLTLKRLNLDKKRTMMNVTVLNQLEHRKDQRDVKNEFDAVVFHNNTLFILECKTKNMKRDGAADVAIYKLAELANESGLRANGVLISCRPVREVDRNRAELLGIKVIDCLTGLDQQLKQILKI